MTQSIPVIARTLALPAGVVFREIEGAMSESAFRSSRSCPDDLAAALASAPMPVPLIHASEVRTAIVAPILGYLYLPFTYRSDPPHRSFAILAPDAAMEPAIMQGDAVIVDANLRPEPERVITARQAEISGRRTYHQDATGATVTARRADDPAGAVIATQRLF
jgi:hypothetical protein